MRGRITFGLCLLTLASTASAGYEEGLAAAQRCDYETANRELSEAAKQGDTDAQVVLVFIGGAGGDEEGLKVLRQAVAANNAGAKYWLAFLTEQVASHPDLAEIRKLIRESAEGGYLLAMAPLGSIYSERRGGSFDPVRAYAWTNLALRRADQDPKALPRSAERWSIQRALDELTRLLSTEEVARAKNLTDELDRQTPRSKLVIPEPCPHASPPGLPVTPPASTVPQVPPASGGSVTRAAAAYAIVDLGTLGGGTVGAMQSATLAKSPGDHGYRVIAGVGLALSSTAPAARCKVFRAKRSQMTRIIRSLTDMRSTVTGRSLVADRRQANGLEDTPSSTCAVRRWRTLAIWVLSAMPSTIGVK